MLVKTAFLGLLLLVAINAAPAVFNDEDFEADLDDAVTDDMVEDNNTEDDAPLDDEDVEDDDSLAACPAMSDSNVASPLPFFQHLLFRRQT